jgi:hypothetical protein
VIAAAAADADENAEFSERAPEIHHKTRSSAQAVKNVTKTHRMKSGARTRPSLTTKAMRAAATTWYLEGG